MAECRGRNGVVIFVVTCCNHSLLFISHLAWSMVSFRNLHRKYELHPGMDAPGLSFFFFTASAIFMKN